MTADRGIDPEREVTVPVDGGSVERLTHAVQALELRAEAALAGHQPHGGQGVGVVGGELAVGVRRSAKQGAGADQIGQVCRRLGRKHRIARQAGDLGAFDLGVPVGPLHQPNHQTATAVAGDPGDRVDHLEAALLIGLNCQAQAPPGTEFGLAGQTVQQVQ